MFRQRVLPPPALLALFAAAALLPPPSADAQQPAAPSPGYNISSVDLCKNFSQPFPLSVEMSHFAFAAHTDRCVETRVYLNDSPLEQSEVNEAWLDPDWDLMCAGDVRGEGEHDYTYVTSDDCETTYIPAGSTKHFYVTMEYVDPVRCDGAVLGGGAEGLDEVGSVETVQHEVCPTVWSTLR